MFDCVLVANRGEIACRVVRTLRELGVRSVVVHTEPDAGALHVELADAAVAVPSYVDVAAVVAAAVGAGAGAVHPGYGFLSEHAGLARAVAEAGLVFVGPSPEVLETMGDKVRARAVVAAAGVPVAAGSDGDLADADAAVAAAEAVGYPVMVKAAGGGGGIGMTVARDAVAVRAAYASARTRGETLFANPAVLVERYVERARHVEVQVLGLADGTVVALGERDCSVQRRHQKLAEETPCPALSDASRTEVLAASVDVARAVDYRGAGTVEWLYEPATADFTFLEMNTRLQVEHPVTELVTGLDLVAEQLRVAAGEPPGFDPTAPPAPRGHAIELRVCAEDPVRFLPGPGAITTWVEPTGPGVRVDAGYRAGDTVTPSYDSLMAKLCVWGADRAEALARARAAVTAFEVAGPQQNLPFFAELLDRPEFVSGDYDTGVVPGMRSRA